MKITELHKYRELSEMLDCIELQLEAKEVHDAVLGDSGEPAYEQVTKPVEGYIHGIGSIRLLQEKRRIEAAMSDIQGFIAAIPVTKIRTALELYCLNAKPLTWRQVAHMMSDEENSLSKAVGRYLKQIEQTKL